MAKKRTAFKLHDAGDDDTREENAAAFLDEQEQEQLIERLRFENDEKNAVFILAFTCLSLFPILFYVVRIFYGNFGLLDALSISSLAMTAFSINYIPLRTEVYKKNAYLELSPAQKYIPLLNSILVGLITLISVIGWKSKYESEQYFRLMPLVVCVFVSLGKWTMSSVNISELETLKYKYKGA